MHAIRPTWLLALGVVQLAALIPIGLVDPMKFSEGYLRCIAIAIVLGCGFAQASVAAAWMVLGPLAFRVRAVVSTAWVLLAALLLAINSGGSGEGLLLGGSFVGVWLLVQGPLWCAAVAYRLRLSHFHELPCDVTSGEHQFGIRQLLAVTAATAATLGFGRLLILGMQPDHSLVGLGGPNYEMFVIVALFVIGNSLVAFTVITGALLPRQWLFAVGLGTCAAAAVTLIEWNLFANLATGLDGGESMVVVGGMNGLQFVWLLACLLSLRAAGYRLTTVSIR